MEPTGLGKTIAWEKGHLHARRFDPNGKLTVPMPKVSNHVSWLLMERWWESAVLEGHKLIFRITPLWNHGRTTGIIVTTRVRYTWSAR
jgi:hypothetical protein